MKRIPLYVIDAFTRHPFAGNPAAVCPLEEWLSDVQMQQVANENNLSETAFFVHRGSGYDLRWFTPVCEVELCGHATLASAFVVFTYLDGPTNSVTFESKAGTLRVLREDDRLALDFPAHKPSSCEAPLDLLNGLKKAPREVLLSRNYLAVYDSEAELRALDPEFEMLARLSSRGVIVTAPGDASDFVSRYFAPGAGINEDPVTGSAHCTLIPYWSERLGKNQLHARQVSRRGGELFCSDEGERVKIAGYAVRYSEGFLYL